MVTTGVLILSNPCGFHNEHILSICMYGVILPRVDTLLHLLQETEPEGIRGELVWQKYILVFVWIFKTE